MTCEHIWMVFSTAMMPPTILVQCADCGEYGGVLDHTKEEWGLAFYAPTTPFRWADDSRVILHADLPRPSPDDLRLLQDFLQHTAGDDDQIDALGTMGWVKTAADDWQAHEFDHLAEHAPTSCTHMWHVRGVAAEEAADSQIELYCLRCHEWATVPDLTDYECGIIGRAWLLGLALEWQDNKRVQLHRDAPPQVQLTLRRGNADEFNEVDDQPRPPAADLVDALDLFEGDDDEDIPF